MGHSNLTHKKNEMCWWLYLFAYFFNTLMLCLLSKIETQFEKWKKHAQASSACFLTSTLPPHLSSHSFSLLFFFLLILSHSLCPRTHRKSLDLRVPRLGALKALAWVVWDKYPACMEHLLDFLDAYADVALKLFGDSTKSAKSRLRPIVWVIFGK